MMYVTACIFIYVCARVCSPTTLIECTSVLVPILGLFYTVQSFIMALDAGDNGISRYPEGVVPRYR